MCFRRQRKQKKEGEDSYLNFIKYVDKETEIASKLELSQEENELINELRKQVNSLFQRRNMDIDTLFSDSNKNYLLGFYLRKGDSKIAKEVGEFVNFSQKLASSYERRSLTEEVYDRLFLKYRLWVRKLLLESGILTVKERELIESLDEIVLANW